MKVHDKPYRSIRLLPFQGTRVKVKIKLSTEFAAKTRAGDDRRHFHDGEKSGQNNRFQSTSQKIRSLSRNYKNS